MTSMLAFDTNAVIAWMRRDLGLLKRLPGDLRPCVSFFVIGELEFGAAKSQRVSENRITISRALDPFEKLPMDGTTARIFGELREQLRRKGKPIPINDVWVAATALQFSMPLISNDHHFTHVAGLELITW